MRGFSIYGLNAGKRQGRRLQPFCNPRRPSRVQRERHLLGRIEHLWQALSGLAEQRPMGGVGRFGLDYAQDIVKRVQGRGVE
jgi:hypothetical protein